MVVETVSFASLTVARELYRHAITSGRWAKLRTKNQLWLKHHGALDSDDELPGDEVIRPVQMFTDFSQCLQLGLVTKHPYNKREHIN